MRLYNQHGICCTRFDPRATKSLQQRSDVPREQLELCWHTQVTLFENSDA